MIPKSGNRFSEKIMLKQKARPIVWSADAEEDLFQIWSYLARQTSQTIADRQIRTIRQACRRLGRLPYSGRTRDQLVPGIRSILIEPYVAFYRVTNTNVEIVRVLPGRRDLEAVLVVKPRH